jgi:hypothetical protein
VCCRRMVIARFSLMKPKLSPLTVLVGLVVVFSAYTAEAQSPPPAAPTEYS